MFAEMYCGGITDIYARIGVRYFRLLNYTQITDATLCRLPD
jgi:hypothetical protein